MPEIGFTAAMKNYFGYKPAQGDYPGGMKGFAEELRKLSHDEKMQFRAMLMSATGDDVTAPQN